MSIRTVDTVLLSHVYPEDEQLQWSSGTIESWDAALVRVEADDGLVGWGEVGQGLTAAEAVPDVVDRFAPEVVGRDATNAREIARDLYDSNVYWARGGIARAIIGGIELALYDLLGKRTGQPLYALLGGRATDEVHVYGSGGIAADIQGRVDQATAYAERGFDTVKIRATPDPMDNVELMDRVFEALPENVDVALDAVQGSAGNPWSRKEAIRLGRALEPHADRIRWYEEPCRVEDIEGHRRVREAVDVPVAGIETRVGHHEFRDVLRAGAVDVLQPDITIAGGVSVVSDVSGAAASYDVPLAMHVWGTAVSLLAHIHYAATDSNCETVEFCQIPNPLRDALLPASFERHGSTVSPPDEPGLGVDISQEFIEEHEFVPGKGHVFD